MSLFTYRHANDNSDSEDDSVVAAVTSKSTSTQPQHIPKEPQQEEPQSNNNRKVQFNNIVTVTEVPSHRTYAWEERFNTWYSTSEFRCFALQERIRKLQTKNHQLDLSDKVRDEIKNTVQEFINTEKRKFACTGNNNNATNTSNHKQFQRRQQPFPLPLPQRLPQRLPQPLGLGRVKTNVFSSPTLFNNYTPPTTATPRFAGSSMVADMQSKSGMMLFANKTTKIPPGGGSPPLPDPTTIKSPVARQA